MRKATEADRNDVTRRVALANLRQDGSGRAAVAEAPTLTDAPESGGLVMFEVTNASKVPLWVSVLSVSEAPSVDLVWSSRKADSGPIEPGGKRTFRVELGPHAEWSESRPMIDRYIAIGTCQPASFEAMEQKAQVWTDSRGGKSGSLPPALQMALSGTRGGAPSPWGCAWLDVHLLPMKKKIAAPLQKR